jgi:ribosome maturation factor RimP
VNNWQRFIATGLAACMLALPLGDLAVSLQAEVPPNPTLTKQQVDRWGVGAEVKVKLAGGKNLRGAISGIEDDSFLLAKGQKASPKRVGYAEVAELKLAKNLYRATGQPDPLAAMRVVEALGIGRHAVVKTAAGQEYHGNIQAIGQGYFTLLPDRETAPVQIAYNNVQQVGPNLSKNAQIAIAIGVCVGIALAILIPLAIQQSNEGNL